MREDKKVMLKLGKQISEFLFEQEYGELKGHTKLKEILESAVAEMRKIIYPS